MTKLLADLRFAARALLKNPGFTLIAVLTLALGIGANTAIFSVVKGVLIEDLPYQDPDRVVRVLERRETRDPGRSTTSLPNILDLGSRSRSIERIAAYDEWEPVLNLESGPERLSAASVSAGYFDVLGVSPSVGRFFLPADSEPGTVQHVVLAHAFWQRHFNGNPGTVGRVLDLNGIPYQIVGVAPAGFEDPHLSGSAFDAPALWRVSPGYFANAERDGRSFTAVARLRPGVSLESARDEAASVMAGLAAEYPEDNAGQTFVLAPLKSHITGGVREPLLVFLGAVAFVLLIACVNVATLVLARNSDRVREISVRSALGASRGRLVGHLLSEGLVLAGLGGLLGVAIAYWATGFISTLGIDQLPRLERAAVDAGVLAFAFVISLSTVVLFALVPAMRASAGRPGAGLESGNRSSGRTGARRTFNVLVAIEVALALALLAGAGLLGQSFWRLQNVDTGMVTEGLLTLEMDLPYRLYGEDPASVSSLYEELERRMGAIPGVESAGIVNILPMSGRFNGFPFFRADRPAPASGESPMAEARSVSDDYFEALGVPVARGRAFGSVDRADSPPVVVINREMAERFWPGEDPLGKRIQLRDAEVEVVGIVGDVHQFSLREAPGPTLYLPQEQAPGWMRRDVKLVVRASVPPASLEGQVRAAINEIAPGVPVSNVLTMDRAVESTLQGFAFQSLLLGAFAAIALLLGATGIYSVIACGVARRQRELGIRQALGAPPAALTRQVVREGMAPVLAGLLGGSVAALFLGRALAGLLFGVDSSDPANLASVSLLLLGVAWLASYLPARHAARIQPAAALREQ